MSVYDALEYRIAKRRVDDFTDAVIHEHHNAMDCLDCEEFLDKGIKACQSIMKLIDTIREANYLGLTTDVPEFRNVIDVLYGSWLTHFDKAEDWIASLREKGHRPNNMHEMIQCREMFEECLQRHDWIRRSATARHKSSSSESW